MKRHILLVEDNPDDAELSVVTLKQQIRDVEVTVVEDGVLAMEFLAHTLPDVVLLDLKLPRMDGHDVLRAIRSDARMKQLPVVILTSSDEEQDVAQSYELGVNSYVRKPVDFDAFAKVAERLGEYWLELNRGPALPRGRR